MTLHRFEDQLKQCNPKLRVRCRGYGDVVGVYGGSGYVCRMTKGELNMNGFKTETIDSVDGKSLGKRITKRGRKTVLNLLLNWRWITRTQRSKILWGILKSA